MKRIAEENKSAEAQTNVEEAIKEAESVKKDLDLAKKAREKVEKTIEIVYEEIATYLEEVSDIEGMRKIIKTQFLKEPEFQYIKYHRTPPLAERKNIIFQPLEMIEAQVMPPGFLSYQERREEEKFALVLVNAQKSSSIHTVDDNEKEWIYSNARISATIDEVSNEEAEAELQCLIAKRQEIDRKCDLVIQRVLKRKLKNYLDKHTNNLDIQKLKRICVNVAEDFDSSVECIKANLDNLIQYEPGFEVLRIFSESFLKEEQNENPNRFFSSESSKVQQEKEADNLNKIIKK